MDTRVKDGKLILGAEEFELPGYSILEAIGAGANAEVFLVYNEVLDRNEALKVWRPHKHQVSVSKEQFYADYVKMHFLLGMTRLPRFTQEDTKQVFITASWSTVQE